MRNEENYQAWRKKNREKINAQEKKYKQDHKDFYDKYYLEYNRKHGKDIYKKGMLNVSDRYLRLRYPDLPKEFFGVKRETIKIKRLIKQMS